MADLTLPGDIPTIPAVVNGHVFVRVCSPVECSRYITADETPVRGVVVALNGPRRAFVAMPLPSLFVRDVPLTSLALRLDAPTGRAHAAWWLSAHQYIPFDRLGTVQQTHPQARVNGRLSWIESAWVAGIGTRGELCEAWTGAEKGRDMTTDQIDTLRRIVLHIAGRTP